MGASIVIHELFDRVHGCDWNFSDAETRDLTHGIHRYSGKFIPQIAKSAIEFLTVKGETILDPFCGSGTTLLEAALLGRSAIGIDLNPLAALIARVKCTPVCEARRRELYQYVVGHIEEFEEDNLLPLFSRRKNESNSPAWMADPRIADPWYQKWFDEQGLVRLVWLDKVIQRIADDDCRAVARVAFSDILRRCSHAAGGYPNVMYDKRRRPRPDPIPIYSKRLREILASIATLDGMAVGHVVEVRNVAAQDTGLRAESVDAIITHPPYIGSIPYAEYGSLSLKWLGYDPKEIDRQLTGGKRQAPNVVDRFRRGLSGMINEAFRVLRSGGSMFVMVGHPLVRGKRIDLATLTLELAVGAGFSILTGVKRQGVNRRANKMGDEDLLFFRKEK